MTASFVGTWRLVSYSTVDAWGTRRAAWDDRPLGQLSYTADGHMSAHVYDARRATLGTETDAASVEQLAELYMGAVSYYGEYNVDESAKLITHHVVGAWLPDWIGTRQERSYRFIDADTLELSAPGYALIWERVK